MMCCTALMIPPPSLPLPPLSLFLTPTSLPLPLPPTPLLHIVSKLIVATAPTKRPLYHLLTAAVFYAALRRAEPPLPLPSLSILMPYLPLLLQPLLLLHVIVKFIFAPAPINTLPLPAIITTVVTCCCCCTRSFLPC